MVLLQGSIFIAYRFFYILVFSLFQNAHPTTSYFRYNFRYLFQAIISCTPLLTPSFFHPPTLPPNLPTLPPQSTHSSTTTQVSGMDAGEDYRFNIVNCEKVNSQYNYGRLLDSSVCLLGAHINEINISR